jgi:multidrug transporter EmrE-like cation transporter
MHPFLMALASIAMSVAAQFCLKTGMSSAAVVSAFADGGGLRAATVVATQPWIVGGFALYGAGAVVWLSVLSAWDVSKAYPLVGLGFAITALIGLLMGEQISAMRLAGVVLVCGGVAMIARS